MSCNGKQKTNGRILQKDIYSYIANNTSLSKKQVGECFTVYRKMLEDIIASRYRNDDLEITLPKIGTFYFLEKKGRKKGSTYKMPTYFSKTEKIRILKLDKDEPTYSLMRLRLSYTLSQKIKEETARYETE